VNPCIRGACTPASDRPATRAAAAVLTAAVLALMVAACGGSDSPPASGSSTSGSYVAYAACMRAHDIPNFPDPAPSHPDAIVGKESAQQLGVSTSTYGSARQACIHLVPNTGDTPEQQQELQCAMGGGCSQAVVQQWMSGLRTLAQCLRTHGEPNWPDPIITSLAGHPPAPHFPYEESGVDHHSTQVQAKVQQCIRITGFEGLPLP
jgi:hypothetical protein